MATQRRGVWLDKALMDEYTVPIMDEIAMKIEMKRKLTNDIERLQEIKARGVDIVVHTTRTKLIEGIPIKYASTARGGVKHVYYETNLEEKPEKFKSRYDKMVAGLQRRGFVVVLCQHEAIVGTGDGVMCENE